MARKPTLSPSKITTYLACPVKYRWTYVDSRGRWYLRAKSYYSFGTTLHRVLQRFHDTEDSGVSTSHEAMAAYEESWIEAGYSSAEEMDEAFGEGKIILERHFEQQQLKKATTRTLFVERQLKMDLEHFVLIGRLDRVEEQEDGTLEIIDYKSGRETINEEDIRFDIAMSCYQLLLREKYPDRKIVATILALRNGATASYSMGQDELAEFSSDLTQLGLKILDTEYHELTPRPKGICRGCDFLPLCRKHEDFEWQVADAS